MRLSPTTTSCTNLVQKIIQFPELNRQFWLYHNKFYCLKSHTEHQWRCSESVLVRTGDVKFIWLVLVKIYNVEFFEYFIFICLKIQIIIQTLWLGIPVMRKKFEELVSGRFALFFIWSSLDNFRDNSWNNYLISKLHYFIFT